jgi:hypothetical protein
MKCLTPSMAVPLSNGVNAGSKSRRVPESTNSRWLLDHPSLSKSNWNSTSRRDLRLHLENGTFAKAGAQLAFILERSKGLLLRRSQDGRTTYMVQATRNGAVAVSLAPIELVTRNLEIWVDALEVALRTFPFVTFDLSFLRCPTRLLHLKGYGG